MGTFESELVLVLVSYTLRKRRSLVLTPRFWNDGDNWFSKVVFVFQAIQFSGRLAVDFGIFQVFGIIEKYYDCLEIRFVLY